MATMNDLVKYAGFNKAILGKLKDGMDSFGDGREDELQVRWYNDKFFPRNKILTWDVFWSSPMEDDKNYVLCRTVL